MTNIEDSFRNNEIALDKGHSYFFDISQGRVYSSLEIDNKFQKTIKRVDKTLKQDSRCQNSLLWRVYYSVFG
jgi:hypothetical protein